MKRADGRAGRRQRGLTLLELLVTLLIAAILAGTAAPSFRDMLLRQRLRTVANDLFAAIDLTRAQAIARGRRVMLAPADAAGLDWEKGWVVFVDRNGNRRPDPDDELIAQQGRVAAGIAIRYAFSAAAPPAYVAYNGSGHSCSAGNSMAAHWGTLSVLLGEQARHIKINMLGRARICDPQAESDCGGAAES